MDGRAGRPSRVLLVEDDEDHAAILALWMRSVGIEVSHLADGADAVVAVAAGEFDLIVSDVQLPGASGIAVVNASKRAHPVRPVVVITAQSEVGVAIEALREGADDYFVKPLSRDSFTNRIARLLHAARSREKRSIVLAIGAHPDDVEIGVGGTLLRHRAKGDTLVVLTLSQGEAGGTPETRRLESERAASRLGADLIMETLPDTRFVDGIETVMAIRRVIDRVRPDVVYTHTKHDQHQDHRAAANGTLIACRSVPSLLCYQSPSTTLDFRPSKYVDVTSTMDGKLDLIRSFATQTDKCAYLDSDLVVSTARYWGRFAGYKLVEPLEVVRSVE